MWCNLSATTLPKAEDLLFAKNCRNEPSRACLTSEKDLQAFPASSMRRPKTTSTIPKMRVRVSLLIVLSQPAPK